MLIRVNNGQKSGKAAVSRKKLLQYFKIRERAIFSHQFNFIFRAIKWPCPTNKAGPGRTLTDINELMSCPALVQKLMAKCREGPRSIKQID